MAAKSETRENPAAAIPACVSGWLVPGLGHLMLGRRPRGLIFFGAIVMLFALGLYLEGPLVVPLETSDVLSFMAGLAEMGTGLPYFAVRMMGLGKGVITSVTYEYGYTFCVVAGLLNMLVVLDAYDIAVGRKD